MFKLKQYGQLSRYGLLATGLSILTLFTTLGGLWHYQGELTRQLSSAQTTEKTSKVAAQVADVGGATTSLPQEANETSQTSTRPSASQKSAGNQAATKGTVQGKTTATASQPVASAAQAVTVSVGLNINGQFKGNVSLPSGSNQCDLLSHALTDGVISSLDMRYSSQYKTEAVYAINGIGDPGSVWWTYTVNGHAPPYGCAHMPAHNGDSVNWQYVKN